MKKLKKDQRAFTIIELLIASAVFSVVILGAGMMILQISRLYYKGTIVSQTQTTARNVVELISRPIQYESATVNPTTDLGNGNWVFCVGNERYTFRPRAQQGKDIAHAMWKDTVANPADCTSAVALVDLNNPGTSGQDMLTSNMRIDNLVIKPVNGSPNLWSINLTVIYGDSDLINSAVIPGECLGNPSGSQWCSVVTYQTMVFKRITK